MENWLIYTGSREPHTEIRNRLPHPPPWRVFNGAPMVDRPDGDCGNLHGARSYRPSEEVVRQVNAALYLRRPLLVTGPPGTGKSTLAYAVAHELGLGPVLHWPITSRVTVADGLYQYDPLTRLYAAGNHGSTKREKPTRKPEDVGRYIRLGPLGTALLPYELPRVLLIDEIDKSDIDLPNDLLTVFEHGGYEIIELARLTRRVSRVMTADRTKDWVDIQDGTVVCNAFPLIIMTSNGDRAFPPAFLRRCVTVDLKQPETEDELSAIVAGHLRGVLSGEDGDATLPRESLHLIARFFERRKGGLLANDQLLNALYLCHHALLGGNVQSVEELADRVMPYLGTEADGDR